jgi:hypothetical protein
MGITNTTMTEEKKCAVRIASPHEFTKTKETIDRDGRVIETKIEAPKKVDNKSKK